MAKTTVKRHPADFNIGEVRLFDNGERYLVTAKDIELRRVKITRLEQSKLYLTYVSFLQQVSSMQAADRFINSHLVVTAKLIEEEFAKVGMDWRYVSKESIWMDFSCCLLDTKEVDYSRLDGQQQ